MAVRLGASKRLLVEPWRAPIVWMPLSLPAMRRRSLGRAARRGAGVALALSCASAGPRASEPRSVATSVFGGEPVAQLALGAYHTCALVESGRVACWGDNQRGQLGQGELQLSAAPVWVPGLDDVVELRAGDAATCARRRTAAVVCWGDNAHGQAAPHALGTGADREPPGAHDRSGEPARYAPGNVRRTPGEIVELRGARALALGLRHGCALDGEGGVQCWGDASFGQLGSGVSDAFQLRRVAGVPPLVEIAAAGVQTCGRTAAGEVWCWGGERSIDAREAGQGSAAPTGGAPSRGAATPAPVPGVAGATRIQAFTGRACAWSASGEVLCWGDSGACADTAPPTPPTPVADYRGSLGLVHAAGGCFWCSIQPSHELSCDMPPPERGRLSIARVRAVAAGNDHACAIREAGDVWCWGSNVRGELGRATVETRDLNPAPVQWRGPQPAEPETP
jgi:hypothetical protein